MATDADKLQQLQEALDKEKDKSKSNLMKLMDSKKATVSKSWYIQLHQHFQKLNCQNVDSDCRKPQFATKNSPQKQESRLEYFHSKVEMSRMLMRLRSRNCSLIQGLWMLE
jgi:hypothetical protein